MNRKICILYGINEGPGIGKRFESGCRAAGLQVVRNPASADLIFAHSGGCLLVPVENRAQKIIMVGIPYNSGRPWLISTAVKVVREGRLYYQEHRMKEWASKWVQHIRYAGNIRAGLRMATRLGIDKPWNSNQPQTIVRNRHDVYCTPEIYKAHFRGPRTFISLPGEHDDCWDNPEPYIKLLQLS